MRGLHDKAKQPLVASRMSRISVGVDMVTPFDSSKHRESKKYVYLQKTYKNCYY